MKQSCPAALRPAGLRSFARPVVQTDPIAGYNPFALPPNHLVLFGIVGAASEVDGPISFPRGLRRETIGSIVDRRIEGHRGSASGSMARGKVRGVL